MLLLSIYGSPRQLREVVADAHASRHRVEFAFGCLRAPDPQLAPYTVVSQLSGYKFPNLNAVLRAVGRGAVETADWVVIVDDDIEIGRRFLDRFLGLLEHFDVSIAQPALTRMSYPAWRVTRRRPFSLLRETWYAEPQLAAFRSGVAAEVLPFCEAYDGFGQDYRWCSLARQRGWRVAIVDAVPMRHESRPYGTQYSIEHSVTQQLRALRELPDLPPSDLERTRSTHRSLRRS